MFAIVFFWTPAHFWALALKYRDDYARAGVPMGPVVWGTERTHRGILIYTLVTVAVAFLLLPTGAAGLIYAVGAAVFGAVSVVAAFSSSAEMLIASRAAMGIAGATIAPSTLSLIFTMFLDTKQRSTAIGMWVAAYSAGGAVGPILGGILLEFFWWGSVFLLGVPVMLLLLVLGPRTLPEYRDPNARRLDIQSAAMSLIAILSVVYGLKEMAQDGFGPRPVVAIVLGVVVGALFVRRQL
jgi:DHA2 family multidrug resistance protein-like MFS transporter